MAALPHAIDDERAQRADAAVGRLALSKCEAADALGVSVDYLEEHVMHELRVVRRGRRRLIPVRELERWLEENAQLVPEVTHPPVCIAPPSRRRRRRAT